MKPIPVTPTLPVYQYMLLPIPEIGTDVYSDVSTDINALNTLGIDGWTPVSHITDGANQSALLLRKRTS